MTYSPADTMPSQSNPYPLKYGADLALWHQVSDTLSLAQTHSLLDLFFAGGRDCTEKMIAYLRREGIAFSCPVCDGSGMRTYWEDLNDSARTMAFEPCWCAAAIEDGSNDDGSEDLPI